MNKYIVILMMVIGCLTVSAQTNVVDKVSTNVVNGKEFGSYELTLGGGGESVNGENTFGLDFSLSTNPLRIRPEVWFGVAQGLYWEPAFAGSTDVFVDWSQPIWKEKVYANVGWSVGTLYSNKKIDTWRTGPEFTVNYYTSGNAFLFAGVNYDVWQSNRDRDNGFRYSFGIGITW
jgi:hypothetical protein